jgi:hypothetical protein
VPLLATEPNILDHVVEALRRFGVVGEERLNKLIYLAVTSRLLKFLVSIIVKGPSSSGKSFTTRQVIRLFPEEAYYEWSAVTERYFAYSEEPLSHRTLVIYEESGIQGNTGSYLVRSLLSEGRINYGTVEKTPGGQFKTRQIVREGPTNLILTTTKIKIHPENETRLLSVPADDTAEQTRNVMLALSVEEEEVELDVEQWHEYQRWLASGETRVAVPFHSDLAAMVPTFAIRLRRDYRLILTLIQTHALLHRASRDRDAQGRIVATLDDYEAVRLLVADLIAEGIESSVPPTVRETVLAVEEINRKRVNEKDVLGVGPGVSQRELAAHLGLDKSTVSRRVKQAIDLGHLEDHQETRGMPAILFPGEPLPEDQEVLPSRDALAEAMGCCSVAADLGGREETETAEAARPEEVQ